MILYFAIKVKDLSEQGKGYQWQRPERCPVCKGLRLWGHGYVERYFEGFTEALWLKRYRCPDCASVHTCRPAGFWKGFRYPISIILFCLLNKLDKRYGRWLPCIARQNQQYWFKGLQYQSSRHANTRSPTIDILRLLLASLIIPASHSNLCEILRL